MTPTRFLAAVLTASTVLLSAARAPAEDVVLTTAAPLAKPRRVSDRSGPADRVELAIFIPDGVKAVRGAVVNPFNLKAVEQEHWREACRLWGFAVIGANYFGVGKEQFAPTLQAALDDFAARSGHPELKAVPFCFVGMSAGAGMSRDFAAALPDRTIAVAPVCLEVAPDAEPLRPIPFLSIFGEKDGSQMKLHLEKLPVNRKAGANWGIAVQWGRRHEYARANNLVVPFFEDVIRQRLPDGEVQATEPVALRPAAQDEAWLGDVSGWAEKKHAGAIAPAGRYNGDPAAACWLPSARVAHAWLAFVSADKDVTIREPAGLGDKQPFVPHDAAKPVPVVVEVNAPGVTGVELYDGEKLLAARESRPFEFEVNLGPGSHPLIAIADGGPGGRASSQPHTVIVKR